MATTPKGTVVKTVSMWFVICESINSALVYSLMLLSPFTHPHIPNKKNKLFFSVVAFLGFQLTFLAVRQLLAILRGSLPMFILSLVLFVVFFFPVCIYLAILTSPPDYSSVPIVVSPFDQSIVSIMEFSIFPPLTAHVRGYLSYAVFVAVAGISSSIGMVLMCRGWSLQVFIHGFSMGVVYALHYLYNRKWVLHFPTIQRSLLFSLKLGMPVAALRALRLCVVAHVFSAVLAHAFSAVLALFIRNEYEPRAITGQFIFEQTTLFAGNFLIFLLWELNHHLHQVLHTKRVVFAPPEGSEAAKANSSEPLLAALEESRPRSLIRYLAYLDLCMVCENNVDTWRRAALFEETGKTYKRITMACLKPLEKLIWDLTESLKTNDSADKSFELINQLKPPTDLQSESRICEAFYDFQLCIWCARIAASLIVRVHKEGRLGVSRLDSYADVMSVLLSCLLAIEAFMGKETDLKKRGTLFFKAYSMLDTLRTSIYSIVLAFHTEMTSGDIRLLDMAWVTNKPLFSTREILLQKLCLFLEFRVN